MFSSPQAVVTTVIALGVLGVLPSVLHAETPAAGSEVARPAVRAFHTLMPGYWGSDGRPQIAECESFIRDVLAPSGFNVLVIEVGYHFQYHSVPRIGNPDAVGPAEVQRLLAACRASGIKLIPQLNCLGHQARGKGSLLGEYPEYREEPGEYPSFLDNPMPEQSRGLSYCPNDPEVHKAVFALLDELAEVFEADAIHVGMDEVFDIASSNCVRCAEKDPAVLFADEVARLHDHLASRGVTMWMWGDRFILASDHGFVDWGWASSRNYTYPAVDRVPKDIVICDWHYDVAPPTPRYFVEKGLPTVAAAWWNGEVALRYLAMMRELARDPDPRKAALSRGVMLTTWVEMQDFITGYYDRIPPLEEQPEWQRTGDFPWKAAARSSAVLRLLAGAWDLSNEALAEAIQQNRAPRRGGPRDQVSVWSGASPDAGEGWAGPEESGSTITVQQGQGRDGKAAVAFHSMGTGWTGGLWNWHGWWPDGVGTDLGERTTLTFWIKATGQSPDTLTVGLGSVSAQNTGQVAIADYCPELWDGQWHEVVVPLQDLYAKDATGFDPHLARQLDLGSWSATARDFTLLIDEIGFDRRRRPE
jgi:hypothetical protein